VGELAGNPQAVGPLGIDYRRPFYDPEIRGVCRVLDVYT
jgi:hypothetical protein